MKASFKKCLKRIKLINKIYYLIARKHSPTLPIEIDVNLFFKIMTLIKKHETK